MKEEIFKGFAHVALHTDRYEEVIKFYTEVLPFTLVADLYVDEGGEDPTGFYPLKYGLVKLNDLYVEIMEAADKRQWDNVTGYFHHIGIIVSDVDKAIAYLIGRGFPADRISGPGRSVRFPYPLDTYKNCSLTGICGEKINLYEKDNVVYAGGKYIRPRAD